MVWTTRPVFVETTWTDCTPAPLLTTSRWPPSGDSVAFTGRSPNGDWLPAGVIVRPLMSRPAPGTCDAAGAGLRAAAKASAQVATSATSAQTKKIHGGLPRRFTFGFLDSIEGSLDVDTRRATDTGLTCLPERKVRGQSPKPGGPPPPTNPLARLRRVLPRLRGGEIRWLGSGQDGGPDGARQVAELGGQDLGRAIGDVQPRHHRLGDAIDERRAQPVAEPAANDDRLQVEKVLGVGQRDAQCPDRLVDQTDCDGVMRGEGLGDHPAGGSVAPPLLHDVEELCAAACGAPAPGGGLHGTATGVRLQVPPLAAAAAAAAVADERVPDLAGGSETDPQLVVEDQAAAHAGAHEDTEEVFEGPSRASLPLAQDGRPDVVVHLDMGPSQRLR